MLAAPYRIVLLLGGARSGKSYFAENCAAQFSNVIYFATAQHSKGADSEMDERIAKHVARRPSHWKTMEPPATIDALVAQVQSQKPDAVIVDCATLWLGWEMSRVFAQYNKQQLMAHMENEIQHFVSSVQKISCPVFVVSNETGMGVVPEHVSGRMFRDCQGILNTQLANHSVQTLFFVAGRALLLKNSFTGAGNGYEPIAAVSAQWVASALKNS